MDLRFGARKDSYNRDAWVGRQGGQGRLGVNEVEPFDSKNSRSSGSFTGAIDLIS